jgi:hypothetical protein
MDNCDVNPSNSRRGIFTLRFRFAVVETAPKALRFVPFGGADDVALTPLTELDVVAA